MKVLRKSLVMLTLILAVVLLPLASYAQSGSPGGTLTLTEKGKQALKAQMRMTGNRCEICDEEYIKSLIDAIYNDLFLMTDRSASYQQKAKMIGYVRNTLIPQVTGTGKICGLWKGFASAVEKLEYALIHTDIEGVSLCWTELITFFKPVYKAYFGCDPKGL